MKKQRSIAESILKFLASLKLAVIVIIAVGVISAWGTIVEARYNSEVATKIVYHSIYMIVIMSLLVINLIAVIVDRYPWKKHHLGFILAHIGIIILLIGSVVTQKMGVDGSLAIGVGQTGRHIQVPTTDVVVWASYNGDSFVKLAEQEVDFFLNPPSEEKPFVVPLPDSELKFIDYIPFAFEERKTIATEEKTDGPALRFQLQNDRVNVSEWLRMKTVDDAPSILNLGPAKIVLNRGNYKPSGDNEIVLMPSKNGKSLQYAIHSKRKELKTKKGQISSGQTIETGWMGLKFRVLKYLPHAKEDSNFVALERPTEVTRAAVKVAFNDEIHWFGLGSVVRFFSDKAAYVLRYGNRQIDIGFPMKLLNFEVGRYQGTSRAASYASDVEVPGVGEVNISMNEPLKHKGYTFYQASFQEDETGKPTVSVFSVNKDPGRFLKYLGSALIVLGSIVMFYFRRILINLYKGRKKS